MSQLMNIHNRFPFQLMYVFWIYNSEGDYRKPVNRGGGGFQKQFYLNWVVSEVSAFNV